MRGRRQWEALLSRWDDAIAAAFMEAIADITNSVTLQDVADALAAGDLDAAVDALQIEGAAFRALDDAIRQSYTAGAVQAAGALPAVRDSRGRRVVVRFDIRAPSAERWLADHSSTLITRIVDEQRVAVRAALVEGMERGQNPRSTALDIVGRMTGNQRSGGIIGLNGPQERTMAWVRQAFADGDTEAMRAYLGLKTRDRRFDGVVRRAIENGRITKADADRIAGRLADRYLKLRGDTIGRTESLASLNGGRTEAFRQAAVRAGIEPETLTRVWSSTGDRRTRDAHREMDGQTVTGLEAAFTSPSGARLMYPGDTSLGASGADTINCRCRVDLRVSWMRQ